MDIHVVVWVFKPVFTVGDRTKFGVIHYERVFVDSEAIGKTSHGIGAIEMRMQNVDVAIIGGGMVGLTLAAQLKESGLRLAIIDPNLAIAPLSETMSVRVSAINRASERVLQQSGVWDSILAMRASAYTKMTVWEKDTFASIQFDAEMFGQPDLGHIIENNVIKQALLSDLKKETTLRWFETHCQQVAFGEQEAWITLASGESLTAKLVVGADGAHSWLRQTVNIPLTSWDYGHHAIVATVRCEVPHDGVARQIFSADGPLAFLPLGDPHLCSIVWSLPPDMAKNWCHCDELEFNKALMVAFDERLGWCELIGERQLCPLHMRYARDFVRDRVALIGDAAHTIHPLAGQGANLGILDAACLAELLTTLYQEGKDIGECRHLRRYERWRKSEALALIIAMQGFRHLFDGHNPLKKFVRNMGLVAVDKLPFAKEEFMRHALGLKGDLPQSAKLR